MKSGDKLKLTTAAVLGGPLAVGVGEEAQAGVAPSDFEALCNTTINVDTMVSDFNDSITEPCLITLENDADLWLENGTINQSDADDYGIRIQASGDSSVHIKDVDIQTENLNITLDSADSCLDFYGNSTGVGQISIVGSRRNNLELDIGDTLSLSASCDVTVKWATLGNSNDPNGKVELNFSSDDQGIAFLDSEIDGCLELSTFDADTSVLIRDSEITVCMSEDFSVSVTGDGGGINIRDNNIELEEFASLDVATSGEDTEVNLSDNDFSDSSAYGASVEVYIDDGSSGSVIYKQNVFEDAEGDPLSVVTDGGTCQDVVNKKLNEGNTDPCDNG
jgi:hypothetical protein